MPFKFNPFTGKLDIVESAYYPLSDTGEDFWTLRYEASVLPTASVPAWALTESGTVTHTVSGGVFSGSATDPTNDTFYYEIDDTSLLSSSTGFTVQAKIKIITANALGSYPDWAVPYFDFSLASGANGIYGVVGLSTTAVGLFWGDTANTYAMDTTDDFHVYRVKVSGAVATLYVDGTQVLQVTSAAGSGSASDYKTFGTSTGTSTTANSFVLDYIYYDNTGAYAPGRVGFMASKVSKTGDTMTGDLIVPDEVYGAGWDGSLEVPTKNAVYDKVQTISYVPIVNTEAVILASTATSGLIAYGTDTQFFYVADGTNWRRASLKFYTDSANPDMGYLQNNSKDGYYATFITDKYLYNVVLQGYNGTAVNGAIRINTSATPDTLEIYMRDTGWFTIIYDLSMSLGYFVHYPFSATQAVKVWSGMSNDLDVGGRPKINEYDISMGAVNSPKVINGGQF